MADDKPAPDSYAPGNPPGDGVAPGVPSVTRETTRPVEIPLHPSPRAQQSAPAKQANANEVKDSFREVIETIVFVVVLVLLLKTFLAEAFVIPTGSMATTLLGYHREVVCQKCAYPFLVNASGEAEPEAGRTMPVVSCTCPNCFYVNQLRRPLPPGELP